MVSLLPGIINNGDPTPPKVIDEAPAKEAEPMVAQPEQLTEADQAAEGVPQIDRVHTLEDLAKASGGHA